MRKRLLFLAAFWSSALLGVPATAQVTSLKATVDACILLSPQEIKAVQGEVPDKTQASQEQHAGLTITQCYFALPTLSHSISLEVTQGSGAAADPRASWKSLFGPDRDKKRSKSREADDEESRERQAKLLKVKGVGEQAYWSGNSIGGSLYVLQRHRYLRISIGGPGSQTEKIQKSKALANKVLKRLQGLRG